MNKYNAANIGKIRINSIEWYVSHHTASVSQQAILSKHLLCKSPTELQYVERNVFMKKVNT